MKTILWSLFILVLITGDANHSAGFGVLRQYRNNSSAPVAADSLLFSDDFNHALDTTVWCSEIAPQPPAHVYTANGRLVLDTKGGVTVWLKKRLKGNIRIEYERTVPLEGGANDRLSDLNQFWMAGDPRNHDLFTRNGVLED